MFDLMNVLKKLDRKIFHSEADFQFNLAWKIKEEYSDAEVVESSDYKLHIYI